MRVRSFLAAVIGTGTSELYEIGSGAEPAIGRDGQGNDASAVVVGDQQVAAGMIHREMARAGAAGRDLVQQSQVPRGWIDREGADGAAFLPLKGSGLIHRVEKTAIRVNHQKGRTFGLRR